MALNAREGTLFRWKEGTCERHEAKKRGRLRFENEGTTVDGPAGITHKAQPTMRSSYTEVERLFPLGRQETTWENDPAVSH
jgi:hypothetical protein